MASGFILRMRCPSGMKRFAFGSDQDLFSSLQTKVQQEFGIEPDAQLMSLKPLADPEFFIGVGGKTFRELGLKHGDLLNIVMDGAVAAPAAPAVSAAAAGADAKKDKLFKLTSKCQHGPKDRCIHCASGDLGKETKFSCNHPPSAVCLNCSSYKASGAGACNHPPTAFCSNCVPEEKKDPNKPNEDQEALKRMFCKCGPGQRCIYCAQHIAAVKVDVIPFQRLLLERRAMCHFKHSEQTQCPSCAPEEIPNFRGNPKCTNGHLPWPNGCCSKCMPPNAVLKPQPYRHCDYIVFQDQSAGNKFVSEWLKNPFIQRAGLLIGNYIDEPAETKNPGALRAQVQAVYYPPQEFKNDRINFLRDLKEETVLKVSERLGLNPVGWCITSLPRPHQDKYGGPMILSGAEVRHAARFQGKYINAENGRSPFVTVLFQLDEQQQVEPRAYQVSDMCVALERDGVLADSAEDVGFLSIRAAKKDEFLPGLMYKDKLMNAGESFLPDELIVKAVVSAPKVTAPMFRSCKFPYVGNAQHISAFLSQQARDDWHLKLSDFNLLIHLPAVIGLPRTLTLCDAVKNKKALTAPERVELEKSLRTANIQF